MSEKRDDTQLSPELRIAFINECHKQAVECQKQIELYSRKSKAMKICAEVMKEKGIDEVDILEYVDEDGNVVVMVMKDGNVVAKIIA